MIAGGGSPRRQALSDAVLEQIRGYSIVVLDPVGTIQTWSAGSELLEGHTADEALGQHFSVFYTPEDIGAGLPLTLLEAARRDGSVENAGWRVRKDGSGFWADVVITALHDDQGARVGYVEVTKDLTEQHALESSLQESENRFRLLVSQVVDYAIIALDPVGVITSWNAGATALKGYTADEAIGRHFSMFYTDDDRRTGLPIVLLERAREQGRVENAGWRLRMDGSRFWADVVITALHDDDGRLTGYAKVTKDLTEQHGLELSLRESERRFRLLISQVVDYAIIALDPVGVITSWNAGARLLKGYEADEAIGQHFAMFYTDEARAEGLPLTLLERAHTEGRVENSGWRVRKDGTLFWGDVVITALHDDLGHLSGYVKVTRDRTDQHRMEDARASFFAAVSHDLRTPLNAIRIYASLVSGVEGEKKAEFTQRIEDNADRLGRMIDTMFEYAKVRAGAVPNLPEPVDLVDAARARIRTLSVMLGEHQVVVTGAGTAFADRGAIDRVLENLLGNAAKYSPAGTAITVDVATVGSRAVLTVGDEGRGIAPEDLESVFDEFERGRLATDDGGTGLGLASVRHLVHVVGGTVHAESEIGKGARFVVGLPRHEPQA